MFLPKGRITLSAIVAISLLTTVHADLCAISIGGNGDTYTYQINLSPGQSFQWNSVPASDFIRSTSGPACFIVYSEVNLQGKCVVLGSNLNGRIRAGIDGIVNKDAGGGDTWRIRSLRIQAISSDISMFIGTNDIRMTYYEGYFNIVPAMDKISYMLGGDGRANVWNYPDFGANDIHNRFKSIHPSGFRSTIYEPGFYIRSIKIWDERQTGESFYMDKGRVLPHHTLNYSVYSNNKGDRDYDGLDDLMENHLAYSFRPIYVNHSTEDATQTDMYISAHVYEKVIEPVTIYQVHPLSEGNIVIRFMKLFRRDVYNSARCKGHEGDTEYHGVYLKTAPAGHALHGKLWYIYRTDSGIENDLTWKQGDGSLRGVHFERMNPAQLPNHEVIYFSKGKHHQYADQGWSGQDDKCSPPCGTTHLDGRGELHNPPLPKRLSCVFSPYGKGDTFNYNNVGSRSYPFFNDLTPFGYTGKKVWNDGNFYSEDASPVDRYFD